MFIELFAAYRYLFQHLILMLYEQNIISRARNIASHVKPLLCLDKLVYRQVLV